MLTVGGLPAHPLLIHAVVVLIPLSALGAVAVAARTSWNRPYAPLVACGALVASITATVSMKTGEQLLVAIKPTATYAPLLEAHGRAGLYTVIASWIFAVLATVTVVLGRRGAGSTRVVATISAVVGLVALVLVGIAGDLGATSVWGNLTGAAP